MLLTQTDIVSVKIIMSLPLRIHIDGTFNTSEQGVKLVFFSIVDKIKLCFDLKVTKSTILSRYHTLDYGKDLEKKHRVMEDTLKDADGQGNLLVMPTNVQPKSSL